MENQKRKIGDRHFTCINVLKRFPGKSAALLLTAVLAMSGLTGCGNAGETSGADSAGAGYEDSSLENEGTSSSAGEGDADAESAAGGDADTSDAETVDSDEAGQASGSDSGLLAEINSHPAEKSQVVTAKAQADGTITDITVETTLKSNDSSYLLDGTALTDLKNKEGDEEFQILSDGTYAWENEGEDITYKASSEEELPVSVKVSYYLDGELMQPEDMAGVSGRVTIRFDYENLTRSKVEVDGKQVETEVPFLVISGVVLDPDVFSDIEVTNGKTVEMAGNCAAVGMAFPGINEVLDLADSELTEDIDEFPEFVEISANAEDFTLDCTFTAISSGLFEDTEEEDFDDFSDMTDDMADLEDASQEILDGIGELQSGAGELSGYMEEYVSGVDSLAEGIDALTEGVQQLNDNKNALQDGADALAGGLASLDSALSTAGNMDLSTVSTAMSALSEDLGSLSGELESLQTSVDAVENYLQSAESWENTVKACISEADNTLANMDTEGMTDGQKNSIASARSSLAEALAAQAPALPAVSVSSSEISALVSDISSQMQIISSASGALSGFESSIGQLTTSVSALSAGSTQLASGISTFNAGIGQVSEGMTQLQTGADQLSTAGTSMNQGISAFAEGIGQLADGYSEFHEEGIKELADLAGSDLNDLINKIKALRIADKNYDNYGGKLEGQKSSVTFLIETDSIE